MVLTDEMIPNTIEESLKASTYMPWMDDARQQKNETKR